MVRRKKELGLQNIAEMVPVKDSQCRHRYELGGALPCTQIFRIENSFQKYYLSFNIKLVTPKRRDKLL